jgi:hypothetical protein
MGQNPRTPETPVYWSPDPVLGRYALGVHPWDMSRNPTDSPAEPNLTPARRLDIAMVAIVALVVLAAIVALTMVALRPTQLNADHGGKIDYSPKVEVTRGGAP